uniref:TonB-dependent receptor n=1 Tax=Blastomonas sp. TaxID=1909299 RepID=UPI00359389C4
DDELRNLLGLVYEDGTLQPGATEQTATFNRSRFIKEFRHRILDDELMSFSAGGISKFDGFTLDYSGAYSRAKQTFPRRQQLVYRSNLRPNLSYDFRDDPNEPEISIFRTQEHLNLDSYAFRQTTVRSQDTLQDELAFAFNVDIPTTLFNTSASYKFGARVRLRDITSDEENFRDRRAGSAPTASLASLLSDERSQNFGYFLGNKFDSGRVIDYFKSVEQTSAVPATRRVPQSTETDYTASENIYAGYAMTRIDFTNAQVILGLRVERTEFEGAAPNFDLVNETFTLNRARNNYTSWFPNATLRFGFTENLIGRFALTRAISRPNYRDNVPRISENSDSAGVIVQVSQGNPDLQPTLANNIDAGLEYYFQPVGLLSANLFYKDLEDYEFTVVANGVFDGRPALITRKDNAPDGRAYGFELAYQQQFTFLPGALSGLGMFANYTWTKASINLPGSVPGRTGRSPLPNQSRHTVNLSLFYETDRFNARISFTDRSDYIDEFNLDPRLDTIWEGREQIDFTTSFDVTKRLNVYFEAKNITNTPGVRYAGIRERVTEYEEFGATYFLGARFNF